MRPALVLASLLPLGATPAEASPRPPASVTVEALAAHPGKWNGKRVRVAGLAVLEFENLGLYGSYDDYCGPRAARGRRAAIYVNWPAALRRRGHFRRMAVVEGRFEGDDGVIVVSTGAPGPGPLTDVRIVRWASAPLTRCGDPRD